MSATAKLKVGVLGATGYSGLELTRILHRHPRLEKPVLLRRETPDLHSKDSSKNDLKNDSENGSRNSPRDLADIFPELSGNGGFPLRTFSWPELKQQGIELLFLATPHEASRATVPEAIAQGLRVIDLSGAWRLKQEQHRAIYGFEDANAAIAAKLTAKAVYGLPELNSDCISTAQLVANPGCYATSVILALAPLLNKGVIDREHGIISDSKSGVSGAGKSPTARTHFVAVAGNLSAYSVFKHRHVGEMVEVLGLQDAEMTFTPHLLPIPRGILSTIYVRLNRRMATAEIDYCMREFYAGRKWVRIFASPQLPEIQFSLHSNYCDLGFCLAQDGQRLVIVSCLDNLLKGAAGQAVQNMNCMYGWDEREGLQ
ncbi:MAG TPA: N-acetyl-gamma-glutamyl-phosphate reductase [Candidatus Aquilonibacter sp.]|nr:N-acetyl-gamma-glutamyl-phosphate reductase [Candidatus Aquilonibacter sp.]